MPYFKDVTLLVTHYNRSESLARLLKGFQSQECEFESVVVSDDCSKGKHAENLQALKDEFNFVLFTSPQNKGLGNNINKGQSLVTTPYTLYVQEDFIPTSKFADSFKEALVLMRKDKSLDYIRFYAYTLYPHIKPYFDNFYETIYKPWSLRPDKIYCYSDHPHLRRSNFIQKFGPYVEEVKTDKTEYLMCVSFIKHKGKALVYKDFKSLFIQRNTNDEPSTVVRTEWRRSNNKLVSGLRFVYRNIKYNLDIHVLPLHSGKG